MLKKHRIFHSILQHDCIFLCNNILLVKLQKSDIIYSRGSQPLGRAQVPELENGVIGAKQALKYIVGCRGASQLGGSLLWIPPGYKANKL